MSKLLCEAILWYSPILIFIFILMPYWELKKKILKYINQNFKL